MLIFHGDNTVASRNALQKQLDAAREKSIDTVRLDARSLTLARLEEVLGSLGLFGTEKLIIIEGLHSLPRSTKKNQLIDLVAASETELILWEKRSLTKTMLKKFPGAADTEFKTSSDLFAWLDTLGDGQPTQKKLTLLQSAIQTDGDMYAFIMLIRQVRLLMQMKDSGSVAGPPFVQKKIRAQAGRFTMDELLALHKKLLEWDYQMKTSANRLSLVQRLDLLTMEL